MSDYSHMDDEYPKKGNRQSKKKSKGRPKGSLTQHLARETGRLYRTKNAVKQEKK